MVNFKNLPITHHRLTVSCSLRQTRPTTLRFTSLSPLFPPCATHHLHSWLRTGYYLQNRRAAGKDAMDAKISSLSTNPYWKTPRCRPRKYKPMAQTYFTEGRDRGPDHCCVRSDSCEQILPPLHHQGWYQSTMQNLPKVSTDCPPHYLGLSCIGKESVHPSAQQCSKQCTCILIFLRATTSKQQRSGTDTNQ